MLVASRVPSQRNTRLAYQVSGHVSYRALHPGTAPGVVDHTMGLRDKGQAVEGRPRPVHQ
jgi:hypothetical protein